MDKMPPAMELLRDWSTWMVGLETGILGLVSFIGGKEGFFKLEERWARHAIRSFALSIFFATWVLASLPSIVLRMKVVNENFYGMWVFEWLHVPLWVFSSAQHWLFVIGVFLLMLSITKRLKT